MSEFERQVREFLELDGPLRSDAAKRLGALAVRELPSGHLVGLTPEVFGWKVWIGDLTGVERFYEYRSLVDAKRAFADWDGEGDPADGWVRAGPPLYRRRIDGDPATEEIRP